MRAITCFHVEFAVRSRLSLCGSVATGGQIGRDGDSNHSLCTLSSGYQLRCMTPSPGTRHASDDAKLGRCMVAGKMKSTAGTRRARSPAGTAFALPSGSQGWQTPDFLSAVRTQIERAGLCTV